MLHCVCVCVCVLFLHACTCRALFEHISAIMKKCLDTLEKQAMIRLDQLIKMVGKVSAFIHSFFHSLTHPFIPSFLPPFTHSFIHSFIPSFLHSFIHSLIHSFTHSFIHLLVCHTPFIILCIELHLIKLDYCLNESRCNHMQHTPPPPQTLITPSGKPYM